MKKILAVILTIAMMTGIMMTVFAEEQPTEGAAAEITNEVIAETPAEEPAPAEAPAEEEPAAEEPAAEAPAEEAPAAEPEAETPAEAPAEAASAAEAPAEAAHVAEMPAAEPEPEAAPAQNAPAEETPAAEPAAEETPVQQIPADETPAAETPAAEPAAEETPVQDEPADEVTEAAAPAAETEPEKAPAEDAPAAEEPEDEASAAEPEGKETPVQNEPVEEVPAAEAPAGEPVTEEIPAQEEAAEEIPAEEIPAEEPAEEPAVEETEEEKIPFTGWLLTIVVDETPYEEGEIIYLRATVKDANMDYSIRWERKELFGEEPVWETIRSIKEDLLDIRANAEACRYMYRAVVTAENGSVIYSNEVTFSVTAAKEEASEATEPETEETETAEPETEEPAVEEPADEKLEAEEIEAEETIIKETEIKENAIREIEKYEVEEADKMKTAAIAEEKEDNTEIIEDYDTALGLPGLPDYEYELDEAGNLVLDEKGNPIVIRDNLAEEDEIPVAFLRDEEGNLILDADGKPIVTQTVPSDATIVNTIEDALDPNRTIDIYYSWNNETPAMGGEVTFVAVLYGYDNVEYNIQWQESENGNNWSDVPEAEGQRHTETITRENYKHFWRVQVTITGVKEG